MALLKPILAATAMALVACGDPIVGRDYSGKPMLTFEGQVGLVQNETLSGAPLRLSIFWSPEGRTDVPAATLIEDRAVTVGVTFPSTFEVNVFRAPEPAWMVPGAGYGIAAIIVYETPIGGDRYVEGESVVLGGAYDHGVMYVKRRLSAEESPTNNVVEAGMHLTGLQLPCGESLGSGLGGEDCGVPFGAPCSGDNQCGALGVCLTELGESLPGGYCAMPADAGCQPVGAATIEVDDSDAYYLATCQQDDECRVAEGYGCDVALEVCLPSHPVALDLVSDFEPFPFCAEVFDEEL